MSEQKLHESVELAARHLFAQVVQEGKKIWMGHAISDDEFMGCDLSKRAVAGVSNDDNDRASKLLVTIFDRMARAEGSGITITKRTGMIKGFNYYERAPNAAPATAYYYSR